MTHQPAPKICIVGSSNFDLIAHVPHHLRDGETLAVSSFLTSFGGKGANQAIMAARLGAEVSVVTKLGRDKYGNDILNNYLDHGIDTTHVMFDEANSSGLAVVMIEENTGQNRIIIVPGSNATLLPEDLEAARDTITNANVLICQLEIPQETTVEALRMAKEQGKPLTILNPSPAVPLPDELLKFADILVPNEIEAAMLTELSMETLDQVAKAIITLRQRGSKSVIITLGKLGVIFSENGKEPEYIPVEQVQAVDTSGAGDAFIGSLAYLLGIQRPMRDAVTRASIIATRSVLKPGTQTSYPKREDIADLL